MADNDEDSIKHFELLKISILARIDDYDSFYKKNFLDRRISFFEKQKFRLRKLIYESEHGKNKIVKPESSRNEHKVSKNSNLANLIRNQSLEENEVLLQVKLNKGDYNKIQMQKDKKTKS